MRLLTLFFAFYLACLSTLTCTDETVVCRDQTIVSATTHSDCATDALGDWCSPLCQCHCCGGVVTSLLDPAPQDFQRPAEWASSPQHCHLVASTPTRALGAVWQPPQA